MKKAVIFDLDGTLTNTLKSLWKSTNMALATAGLPPHISILRETGQKN